MNYVAPAWLPGGHLQTIWPALFSRRTRGAQPQFKRERWHTPDQDFVDVDWLCNDRPDARCLLVMFHGLEGDSSSHYSLAFASMARDRGMAFAIPHFRGCSGEINLAPRAYHSGDFEEVGWMLERFKAAHSGPIVAVGVSLGGNALMRWAQEAGAQAGRLVQAVVSVCSPLDLAASGHAISHGFNRMVYTRRFLNSMKPNALRKLAQYPGLFDRDAMLAATDLHAFDNVVTAPLHGFKNTDDYWERASAKPHMRKILIPALALNARNDPFVPCDSLPLSGAVGEHVTLWQPNEGGHVGFPAGNFPGHVMNMPALVTDWLAQHVPIARQAAKRHGPARHTESMN